jgi:hypothetical protein
VAEKPPLRPEEVERILRELEPLSRQRRIILIGGQAVAFWAAFFELEDPSARQKLFTSKDIDFEGASRTAREAAELLGGEVRIPEMDDHTPNTGLVLFQDSDGIERELDFLGSPLGLRAQDVRDTAVQLRVPNPEGPSVPIWVMHPQRCMESRVYNVMELGQSGPIAMEQLRESVTCTREYSRRLLGLRSIDEKERIRAVLRLNERIFRKCHQDRRFRDVVLDHNVDPFEAVLVDGRLPDEFHSKRHPQMVEKLTTQRNRARAQRKRYAHTRRRKKG